MGEQRSDENTWWIDESPYAGPYRDDGFIEVFQRAIDGLGLALQPFIVLGRQYGKMFASIDPADLRYKGQPIYYATYDEILTEEMKKSETFAAADAALKVPKGTTEKLAKQYGEISDREQKRQIGRGNVSGHGPRSGTTFGRKGKRRY